MYFWADHAQDTRPVTGDVKWYLGHLLFLSLPLFFPFIYFLIFYLSNIRQFIKIQKVYRHKLIIMYPLTLMILVFLYTVTF